MPDLLATKWKNSLAVTERFRESFLCVVPLLQRSSATERFSSFFRRFLEVFWKTELQQNRFSLSRAVNPSYCYLAARGLNTDQK